MKWVVSQGKKTDTYDADDLYKLLELYHDPQEMDNVVDTSSMIQLLQAYFTHSDQPGYKLYSTTNNFIENLLCQLLQAVNPEYLAFEQPYNKKELSLLWIALNIMSEVLEWWSSELQTEADNLGIKSIASLFLDSLSIIISLRMRELTENRIYGDIVDDRDKWGFLLKDLDKQVVAQLLNISLDVSSLFSTLIKGDYGVALSDAMTAIMGGATTMNAVFIKQAYDGLMKYSNNREGWGWIAWLMQEFGYLSQNDLISENIGDISPISMGILGDIASVIAMGMILYTSS